MKKKLTDEQLLDLEKIFFHAQFSIKESISLHSDILQNDNNNGNQMKPLQRKMNEQQLEESLNLLESSEEIKKIIFSQSSFRSYLYNNEISI